MKADWYWSPAAKKDLVNPLDEKAGRQLLALARRGLAAYVQRGEVYRPDLEDLPPYLQEPGSSFVTLRNQGLLRGCIGSTGAELHLAVDVIRNAAAAARDPRFRPVTPHEIEEIRLEVSVLQPARLITYRDEFDLLHQLRPGIDGVIVSWQERRALLLPQVWRGLSEPGQFLQALLRKAKIPRKILRSDPPVLEVQTFEAHSFEEDGYFISS